MFHLFPVPDTAPKKHKKTPLLPTPHPRFVFVQAENELKVLKRCMGTLDSTSRAPVQRTRASTSTRPSEEQGGEGASDAVGTASSSSGSSRRGKSFSGSREASGGAWGWVEGVAQRATVTLARRHPPPPTPPLSSSSDPADGGADGEEGGREAVLGGEGRGDAGNPV